MEKDICWEIGNFPNAIAFRFGNEDIAAAIELNSTRSIQICGRGGPVSEGALRSAAGNSRDCGPAHSSDSVIAEISNENVARSINRDTGRVETGGSSRAAVPAKGRRSVAGDRGDHTTSSDFADAGVIAVANVEISGAIHGNTDWTGYLGGCRGPSSPLNPGSPVPATVVMRPSLPTLRTRSLFQSAINRLPVESTATPIGPIPAAVASTRHH